MIKKIEKLKNIFKKGLVPYEAKGFRSGFVILFAVTLSSILLAIALGVVNVALKEIKFGTSAKDTNNAFFAADSGTECALVNDKSGASLFVTGNSPNLVCNNTTIVATESPASFWTFTLSGLGSSGQSCAKVTVNKTVANATSTIAKGYNIGDATCSSSNPDRIEREIRTNY